MRTLTLTVGPDGRVEIPGAKPGQTVTVELLEPQETPSKLTLASAQTAEERDAVIGEIKRLSKAFRKELSDEDVRTLRDHADWLYDDDGLPR